MRFFILFQFLMIFGTLEFLIAQIPFPGTNPGHAKVKTLRGGRAVLENELLSMEFTNDLEKIKILRFRDKKTNSEIRTAEMPLFEIILRDNTVISSDEFSLTGLPITSESVPETGSTKYSASLIGKKISAVFENHDRGITVHWEAELRDGSNYVRQIFRFKYDDVKKIAGINMIRLPLNPGIRKEGTVEGSPVVCDNMFFALEHPLSAVKSENDHIICYLPEMLNEVTTVWGVTPVNQMRRGFQYYVERERLHQYHQVLHYNSWYDISWTDRKFDEKESSDRIRVFGDSLIRKRGVKMDAFLFDDGWDDNKTLWRFHTGFPDGFSNIGKLTRSYDSHLGVWLSPFGGYGEAKASRIEYGNRQNPPFETNRQGFSLAGPVYYERFKEVTGNFIKNYDVSMFKFDGVGAGSGAMKIYRKDVEAFLSLLKDLVNMKPGLYLSLTTGTWPSVYWLMYGDNIWRGGDDTNMMGEGSKRQQWITYRDADVYKNVVTRGPLFPLNSLMLCGICIADNGYPGSFEMNDKDIADEIWSFFATGTNLQELYINPHKLNTENWDCLADAARWAKDNEQVLADVHWIGGDPSKGEVYGFAAWSPGKAVMSIRNPSGTAKSFEGDFKDLFELPGIADSEFKLQKAGPGGAQKDNQPPVKGSSLRITLKPFEVIVFDAFPVKQKK